MVLSGTDIAMKAHVSEDELNTTFSACPTYNEDVMVLYIRKNPIPYGFYQWPSSDNVMTRDFELYVIMNDLIYHEGK